MTSIDVDHIVRPKPPWRTGADKTECGRSIPERGSKNVISRHDMAKRVRDLGKTRTAMISCITCWETAERWKTWAQRPSDVLGREIDRWRTRFNDEQDQLDRELEAIAALIKAHQDEFDEYLRSLEKTTSLEEARSRRRGSARPTRW